MDPRAAYILEQVRQHSTRIRGTATSGLCDAWRATCTAYQLAPPSGPELRPIAPDELAAVLGGLAAWARSAMAAVPPGTERAWLEQEVSTLTTVERPGAPPSAALGAPSASVGLGLGGLFANASSVTQHEGRATKHQHTLKCPACGSVQERAGDFKCRYCGGSLAG